MMQCINQLLSKKDALIRAESLLCVQLLQDKLSGEVSVLMDTLLTVKNACFESSSRMCYILINLF